MRILRKWDFAHGLECGARSPTTELYYAFLKAGSPNKPGLPPFAMNDNRVVQSPNVLYIGPVEDEPLSRKRYTYRQQTLYR